VFGTFGELLVARGGTSPLPAPVVPAGDPAQGRDDVAVVGAVGGEPVAPVRGGRGYPGIRLLSSIVCHGSDPRWRPARPRARGTRSRRWPRRARSAGRGRRPGRPPRCRRPSGSGW